MKAAVIPCGPAVNESERRAVERLKSGLIGHPGDAEWLLLTNLTFSATHRLQSDEGAHDRDDTVAPEVHAHGRGAADRRSDVYALCASLSVLFDGRDDEPAHAAAIQAIAAGTAPDRAARASPADLDRSLSELLGESPPTPPAPPARFWTEDQVVRFDGQDYRIVAKLGSGGVGATFKVVEIDRDTKEDLGAYVAKVVRDRAAGQRVLRGHRLVRSHLRRAAFSTGTRAYSCSVRAGCPTPTSAPRRLRRQPPSGSLTSRRRRVDRMPRRPTPRQPNPRILRRLLPKLPRSPRPSAP